MEAAIAMARLPELHWRVADTDDRLLGHLVTAEG
jgi:hypothetical protein